MSHYQHIFFDLDRTLWDFETNSYETLSELVAKYKLLDKGINSTTEFINRYLHINQKMWEDYGKGLIDKTELRYGRFQKALNAFQIEDQQLADNIANDYIALSPLKTNLFPHATEVLYYLSKKYVLHIITNGFEEVQHVKIKNCGIDHYFSEVVTSERTGYKKPDTRIFQYSIQLAKTNASQCLMIGDSLDADIIGARNAGLHQVYFNPSGERHTEAITHEIRSLRELMVIL
jgi:putative hydrolase of the HAD superfamily